VETSQPDALRRYPPEQVQLPFSVPVGYARGKAARQTHVATFPGVEMEDTAAILTGDCNANE